MYRLKDMPPRVSNALALPAPTGGINDLDPLSNMDSSFLIDGMNFFMDTGLMVVRPGYQEWSTGLTGPVKTIMSFNSQSGAFTKFAATDAGIYDVTTSSANPPIMAGTAGTGPGYWVFTNFATAAGQFLIACNGTKTIMWDGAAWVTWTEVTTPAGPGQIKGVNPDTFDYVIAHKGRLWFIQKNTMTMWYLPIDSVGGEAKPFFVGGIFRRGGYLNILARWSSDTGEGLDDRLILITSTGEIASYQGTDPADAVNFSLDSIFFVAPPLSKRAVTEYGGDLLLLCRRGLVPLSSLIAGTATEVLFSGALTRRISRTLIRLTQEQNPPFPPEVALNNDAAWTIINLFDPNRPNSASFNRALDEGSNAPIQLCMNFLTGAWGKFNFPIRTMRNIDALFHMGTEDGRVLVVTTDQFQDNVPLSGVGGTPISASAMGAYTYLENPTANKHAKLIRPVFQSDVKPSFLIRVLPDFRLDRFLATPPPNPAQGNARWDISLWDAANWAGLENVYRPWVSANQLGYAFAWQLKVSTSSGLGLAAIEWVWENGGYV